MPTITVIRKDLERLAGQTYDLPELERALEAVKAEVKVEDDALLKIQLKDTNRPDLWSSEGVARLLKGIARACTNPIRFSRTRQGNSNCASTPRWKASVPTSPPSPAKGSRWTKRPSSSSSRLRKNWRKATGAVEAPSPSASTTLPTSPFPSATPRPIRMRPALSRWEWRPG